MSLDVIDALENGFRKTFSEDGLKLAGIFFVISLLTTIASESLTREFIDRFSDQPIPGVEYMFELSLSLPVSAGLLLVGSLASAVVSIAALRALSSDRNLFSSEVFTEKMLHALVHTFIGGIVFGIAVLMGLALIVVPGLYLMTVLYFWTVIVAVEHKGFLEAMRESIDMTSGNRWQVLGLLLAVIVVSVGVSTAVSIPVTAASSFIGGKTVAGVVSLTPSAFTAVFALGTITSAYNQLKN